MSSTFKGKIYYDCYLHFTKALYWMCRHQVQAKDVVTLELGHAQVITTRAI